MKKIGHRSGTKGNAMIEVAFMVPWIFFLFVGVLDFGFYSYAAICVQNAARIAALGNSYSAATAGSSVNACQLALQEMNSLPNVRTLADCGPTQPVTVTVSGPVPGPDSRDA